MALKDGDIEMNVSPFGALEVEHKHQSVKKGASKENQDVLQSLSNGKEGVEHKFGVCLGSGECGNG